MIGGQSGLISESFTSFGKPTGYHLILYGLRPRFVYMGQGASKVYCMGSGQIRSIVVGAVDLRAKRVNYLKTSVLLTLRVPFRAILRV